jgi:hypothetical protein
VPTNTTFLLFCEATAAGDPLAETAGVDVALAVALGETETGDVEAAAVDEVELVGVVDAGAEVDCGAEVEPTERHAADHAGIDGQRDQVGDALFVGDHADRVR